MWARFKKESSKKDNSSCELLIDRGFFPTIGTLIMHILFWAVMMLMFPLYLLKIKNRKYFFSVLNNKRGAISVANHCYYLDSGFISLALFPHFTNYAVDEHTMSVKFLGYFLKRIGGFPVSQTNFRPLYNTIGHLLKKNRIVHLFPEGNMLDYNQRVAEFERGAFYFALAYDAPILPIAIVLKKRPLLRFLTKPLPRVEVHLCKPIYLEAYKELGLSHKELLSKIASDVQTIIDQKIQEEGGDYTLFAGKIDHKI